MKKQFVGDDISFRKLIENSYSGITLFDKDFNIIYRSPSVEHVNGWSDAERMKSTLENLIHPLDRNNTDIIFKKVLVSPGKPFTLRFRLRHFQGYYIWLECTFTNMFGVPGIKAIVCNSLDISDRVQADELLQQSIKELSAYKHALDESSIVAVADENGIIRHVNNNFCKISHYSKEEAIGQNHSNFNYSLQNEGIKNKILETIATGKIWRGELKKRTKDDGNYWVDTTIVPFLNQKGKPYRYVTIQNDITERRKSEERVIRSEAFTKKLADNLPAMVAYWTANRRCLFANKAYSNWFGKEPNEMRGLGQVELMGHDGKSHKSFEKHISAVLNGETQSFENLTQKADGSPLYLHMHYLPDKEHDKIRGYYSFVYDITESKNAELEVQKKNAQIENILESITDGFITLDENMCYTYANKQIGKILNVDPKKLIGKNIWDMFPEAIGSETYKGIQKVYQDREYVTNEDYYSPLKLWQENHIYPAEKGVSIFIRDITKNKEEEFAKTQLSEAITESLKERNTILESITDAFYAVDKNWIVTYWNNTAEKVLHKTKKEMLDKNLWDVFSQSDNPQSYNYYEQALKSGKAVHFEDYYEPLKSWFEISAYPSVNGLSVYFKVITERKLSEIQMKNLNESLQKQTQELSISNAELEQFAHVVSHDLQEPLRMITSFLTQLDKKYNDIIEEQGKKYIYFAVDGAKRMRQIILDLLDFSRVGRSEDDAEDVDLNKVMGDILALFRKKIEDRQGTVLFTQLPSLHTYTSPIRQVFQNLIGNALKYQKPGIPPVIEINCTDEETDWQFSVKDNGMGINKAHFDSIFIIFKRLHSKDEYPGNGMGLAITKKIIENMQGKIWLESEEGEGSTFYFRIPKHHKK